MQGYHYLKCGVCGSLEINGDILPNYKDGYYSFNNEKYAPNILEKIVLNNHAWVGKSIFQIFSGFMNKGVGPWLNVNRLDGMWLDYGAGNGAVAKYLSKIRKKSCYYYDPFEQYENINHIRNFRDYQCSFNLITLNHSLEHSFNPNVELLNVNNLLVEGGIVVIRVPLVTRFWVNYLGDRWRQLDPPYHRTLATKDGLSKILKRNNFTVIEEFYDGSDLPWRSLFPSDSWLNTSRFARLTFRVLQALLNQLGYADQIGIVAKKN